MPLNYEHIRNDNIRRFGTDVSVYGKLFFKDLYADPLHFIFELLQNTEDAIARQMTRQPESRTISFSLTNDYLRVSHFGAPFDESDVRAITSIAESTKTNSITDIGRFGIGFKSVYAFTDRPEVHSGVESFAIEHFVRPSAVEPLADKEPGETVILLPFNSQSAYSEIDDKLKRLGTRTLLFLEQIEEITWENDRGDSGHYIRDSECLDRNVRRVTIIGNGNNQHEIHEEWLMFDRQVARGQQPAGQIAIAFSLDEQTSDFRRIDRSTLFAYFPTELETHFGFLANGPYQTTLNRENIPGGEKWNQHLVQETASLLISSLRWLKDQDRLQVAALWLFASHGLEFTLATECNTVIATAV